jgi:IS605 OrfB family transposase
MKSHSLFTYHTRLAGPGEVLGVLDAYAAVYGTAERSLFAAMQKPDFDTNKLKRQSLTKFGITSRQFNALRIGLGGKIDAIKSRRPDLIVDQKARIKISEKVVAKLGLWPHKAEKLHQKKRSLEILKTKLVAMEADEAAGTVRLCFGSKKLFNAQFHLEDNGYETHAEWLSDWQEARSSQFFVLGSCDEVAGNNSCQASIQEDGSLTLHLRIPNALVDPSQSKYLTLLGIRFAYGHKEIVQALQSSHKIQTTTKAGKKITKLTGTALSYRFLKDAKGWRVFVSCTPPNIEQVSNRLFGAIGIDINTDHLAVCETDRFGNLIKSRRIDLPLAGKTKAQVEAIIEGAVKDVAYQAKGACKPVGVENLDFAKKKAELEAMSPAYCHMLSSFACNKIISSLKSACFKAGVEVIGVNPAYTSVIGAINYAQSKGISTHMGAALAVARRSLGLSERVLARAGVTPTRTGGHVTFCLPVRNRQKHVWSQWAKARTSLKAALAAHYRSGALKKAPAPLTPRGAGIGCFPVSHGETPSGKSSAKLFGWRDRRSFPADGMFV